jgi:hypothetical protein
MIGFLEHLRSERAIVVLREDSLSVRCFWDTVLKRAGPIAAA